MQNISTMVNESCDAISVNLNTLCQFCGQIALYHRVTLPDITDEFAPVTDECTPCDERQISVS
jgi:hypothetical protein